MGLEVISLGYRQSVDGCLDTAIGGNGLSTAALGHWLERIEPHLEACAPTIARGVCRCSDRGRDGRPGRRAGGAHAPLRRRQDDPLFRHRRIEPRWPDVGAARGLEHSGRRRRGATQAAAHALLRQPRRHDTRRGARLLDLSRTRFVVTSKSGGTTETLAQAIAALSAVKAAGLEAQIPKLFLGITEPATAGRANGLRELFGSLGISMLEHHSGIGGRFSCLTNVGLMPALARGLDCDAIRAGARSVVEAMMSATSARDYPPALGAAAAIALSKDKGIRTLVMMPYNDRLSRLSAWFAQLWAESLGKNGEGTSPIAALGPLDQHSQLQLFMDGPREHLMTVLRVASRGKGPVIDAGFAKRAGIDFMGGKTVGDVVDAQAHAVPEALNRAGRPVRTFDVGKAGRKGVGRAAHALYDRDNSCRAPSRRRSVRSAGRRTRQGADERAAEGGPLIFLLPLGRRCAKRG